MDNYKSYLDCSAAPLFSFGFGLGYTDFDYSETVVEVIRDAKDNPELIVSSKVTNIGSRSGATVAQCYLFDPVAEIARPCKELKGFQRVALEPGESESLCFKLDSTSLGYYNENGDFRVDCGDFLVGIGPNSMIELTTLVTI